MGHASFPVHSCYDNDPSSIDSSYSISDPVQSNLPHVYSLEEDEISKAFNEVHNSRNGHHGASLTYFILSKLFLGHEIPFSIICDMVCDCPVCRQHRKVRNSSLQKHVSHLDLVAFQKNGWVGV